MTIPHMGWNHVHQERDHPMWQGIAQDSYFYFVHSYYVTQAQSEHSVGTTDYGNHFTSVVAADNVFAAQFHPEKSQQAGLTLSRNFVNWDGSN